MKFTQYLYEQNEIDKIIPSLEENCKPFLNDWKKCNSPVLLLSGRKHILGDIVKYKVKQDRIPRDTPLSTHKALDDVFYKKFGIRARSQCLFCTSNMSITEDYGKPFIVIPIGKYEVIWSPTIDDLWMDRIMDSPYKTIDNIEQNWKNKYSYPMFGKGHYEYKGIKLTSKFPIAIKNELFTQHDISIDDYRKLHNDPNLKWIPEVSFKDFKKDYEKNKDKFFNNLINEYRKGNLCSAIRSQHEVMLYCKECYLIHERFIKHLPNFIKYKHL